MIFHMNGSEMRFGGRGMRVGLWACMRVCVNQRILYSGMHNYRMHYSGLRLLASQFKMSFSTDDGGYNQYRGTQLTPRTKNTFLL